MNPESSPVPIDPNDPKAPVEQARLAASQFQERARLGAARFVGRVFGAKPAPLSHSLSEEQEMSQRLAAQQQQLASIEAEKQKCQQRRRREYARRRRQERKQLKDQR